MSDHKFALFDTNGQVIRVFDLQADQGFVIFDLTERRLRVVSEKPEDSENLKMIAAFRRKEIQKKPQKLNGIGFIGVVSADSDLLPDLYRQETEQKDRFVACFKWVSSAHIALLMVIFLLSMVIKPWLEPEKPTVQVLLQAKLKPNVIKRLPPIEVSEKKIKPTKRQANSNRNRHKKVTKNVSKKKVITRKVVQRSRTPQPRKLTDLGALGALGGHRQGSKKSAGLRLDAAQASLGSGAQSANGGRGGHAKALSGKGLVASGIGSGGRAEGAGGYGTRGQGGGKIGYGQHNMAGSSSAYSQPIEEEALVQGGLDRDQVAAVIRRNIGQIIYCYEKGLQSNPNLRGRVTMGFEIGARGQVNFARAEVSSLKSASVESCMSQKMKGWQFPKPVGNVTVKVSYPFVLKRLSQG